MNSKSVGFQFSKLKFKIFLKAKQLSFKKQNKIWSRIWSEGQKHGSCNSERFQAVQEMRQPNLTLIALFTEEMT